MQNPQKYEEDKTFSVHNLRKKNTRCKDGREKEEGNISDEGS